MGFVQRGLVKFVVRVVSYPRVTLALCGAALVGCVLLAMFNLQLSTDHDALLTPKLPFFRDYMEFSRRFPEQDSYVVVIQPWSYEHPPEGKRWMAYADRIGAALSALKDDIARVEVRVPPEAMGDQGLLFAPWDRVKSDSAHLPDLVTLARIAGDPDSTESLGLRFFGGGSMTGRVLGALARGPAKDSREMGIMVMQTLANAIRSDRPFDQWQVHRELPSLADADPRSANDPYEAGYSIIPDETKRSDPRKYQTEKLLVVNVYAIHNYSSLAQVSKPLQRMREAVTLVAKDFPDFKPPVVTGRPALEADEMQTSDHDTKIAEILGLSLVFVVMLFFLRSLWLVIVAELCLGVGIGWTFGWATLAIGRLNLLSLVFVIALIGIGMDYLIQILTRYRFEKKRYGRPQAVWARVFRFMSAPISTACCGAAGAFLVSRLTNFQGAGELGVIAGGGLLLCLLTGYTVLPALLTIWPASVGRVHESRRYRHREPHPGAGGWRLVPSIAWMAVAFGGLMFSLPPQFDSNLLRLQADDLPSVKEVRKLQTWSAVVLSPDKQKLRQVRDAMTAGLPSASAPASGPAAASRQATDSMIDYTDSIVEAEDKRQWLVANNAAKLAVTWRDPAPPAPADLLGIADDAETLVTNWSKQKDPGDLTPVRAAADALVAAIRAPSPDDATKIARVAEWQRRFVQEVRTNVNQFAPAKVDEDHLPQILREHLISDPSPGDADTTSTWDGKRIYALYIYPKADLWETDNLNAFVAEVERRFKPFEEPGGIGRDVVLTGIAPQLVHSKEEIYGAFMHSTVYALILIFILVLLDLRKLGQTLLAISVLATGLPMLLLMMYLWRDKWNDPLGIPGAWNFANFFALPILIGAGHEYGVFMVHRYREALHDPRRVWRTWDVADRALLLCGIVTSASFGFLVSAKHHGLQSLGWVMAVGTACIYLATVLVLRPILLWRLKKKGVYVPTRKVTDGGS